MEWFVALAAIGVFGMPITAILIWGLALLRERRRDQS
jgi:hypothetical protein